MTPELLRIVLHSGKHLGKRYFTLYACPRKEYYCPRHYLELLKGNIFDHLHWFICACDNVFLGKWNTVKSIIRTFTCIADASLGHTKSVEHSLCTTSTDAEILLCLDAFRRLIFCAQTHARKCRHMHVDERTRIQDSSAALHVQAVTYMFRPWVSLPANPCPILVAFKIQKYSWHLIDCFQNPAHQPTALRTSISLGGLLDSCICFIESHGFTMVFISCR